MASLYAYSPARLAIIKYMIGQHIIEIKIAISSLWIIRVDKDAMAKTTMDNRKYGTTVHICRINEYPNIFFV